MLHIADEPGPIPDELRDQYLKYRVDIRVLGVERLAGDKLIFVPSHRRLPHVGAKVALCSPEVLREVANASGPEGIGTATIDTAAAEIGFLAFGEFVYAGDDPRGQPEDWMVVLHPPILPRFHAAQLVSRRTFVFARAGFGKSNLIKLLFSRLYAGSPVLPSRNGPTPVGTIIFDPDGEYFWPDSGGRPGLADVPLLTERTVVFTSQQPPSPAYGSFVVDSVKLDIRQLSAQRVIGIALPADRQDQQNVTKISQLRGQRGLQLASIILAEIFAHNQREFTKAIPHNVPCIAVIEEAQTVLGAGGPGSGSGSAPAEDSPFVSWVKEGRKYGLGAVLVTQQPGRRQPLRLGPSGRPPGADRDPGPAGLRLAHRVPPPPRPPRILPDLDPPHGNGRVLQPGNPARGFLRLNNRIVALRGPYPGATGGDHRRGGTQRTSLDLLLGAIYTIASAGMKLSSGRCR